MQYPAPTNYCPIQNIIGMIGPDPPPGLKQHDCLLDRSQGPFCLISATVRWHSPSGCGTARIGRHIPPRRIQALPGHGCGNRRMPAIVCSWRVLWRCFCGRSNASLNACTPSFRLGKKVCNRLLGALTAIPQCGQRHNSWCVGWTSWMLTIRHAPHPRLLGLHVH